MAFSKTATAAAAAAEGTSAAPLSSEDLNQYSEEVRDENGGEQIMKSAPPTVGIVGGGVAGLQTARALLAKGFEVTVFESASTVGGVWRENYLNFGLQVPKEVHHILVQ